MAEGKPNTLVVAVHRAGDLAQAGIYGNVSLRVLPQSFIHDVVVQPQVAAGKIRFSCDLWHATAAADAQLEFEVTPDNDVMTGKVFGHTCRLKPADRRAASFPPRRSASKRRSTGTTPTFGPTTIRSFIVSRRGC